MCSSDLWPWPSSLVSDNGDVVPRGLVAQCGTRTVSLAGWWLVAAGRAQQREYGDREGGVVRGTAVSLVPAHHPQPLCSPPDHAPLPLSPFSPYPHTHRSAVPCSLPPATNLQGTRFRSHTGPPTPVAPCPRCHSPRMRATTIGAMKQEQRGAARLQWRKKVAEELLSVPLLDKML